MSPVSVVLAGCGAPVRSMGWYHAVQILDSRIPYAVLKHVVEPWYMTDAAKGSPGYKEFHNWRNELENKHGISFHSRVQEIPKSKVENETQLAILSSRTSDNPVLFRDCTEHLSGGCKAIYLEKPGAPTVAELERMRDQASAAGINVFMGFNKNVSSYLTKTREFAGQYDGKCDVTFLHNNNYPNTQADLAECFERNSEGMLKNMAIHELAILVTYYGVSVDDIAKVEADTEFSSCQTLKGPLSGKDLTDFTRLKFKITTTSGTEINVAADRCGGDDSVGIVTDASTGEELARYSMPDEAAIDNIPNLKQKYGEAMPYFYAQDPDYARLKEMVVLNTHDGSPAEGVATIDTAIETLKVAEHLTPILMKQLSA